AIVRAAVLHLRRELHRNGAGLVEFGRRGVKLRIAIYQPLEESVVRASLPHVDFVVADEDMAIDDAPAFGANGSSQLVEDVVGVLFRIGDDRVIGSRTSHVEGTPRLGAISLLTTLGYLL